MYKINRFFYIVFLIVTGCVFVCCNSNKEKIIAEQSFSFLDDNWNFEQRLITFDKVIKTEKPCKIVLELTCTKELTANNIPITLSVYDAEGGESHRSSAFNFAKENAIKTPQKELTLYRTDVYPVKYFNVAGTYTFRLLHTYSYYDLLGIRSVTLKVIETKENQKIH